MTTSTPTAPVAPAAPTLRPAQLPPGPRLPRLIQTLLFGGLRPRYLRVLHRRYGSAFTVRLMPGRTMVVLSDPADIKATFMSPTTLLHAGEGNSILEPAMGNRSVLLVDEADHVRIRRLLMPAFHGAPLAAYRDVVARLSKENVEAWPVGTVFAAHDRTAQLTRDIILTVVFGVTDPERLAALIPPVDRIVKSSLLVTIGMASPRLRKLPPWNQYATVQQTLDDLLYAEIAERRVAPDLAARTDVLSQLIRQGEAGLTDREIRDNLITLLLAGHETTATSLAWAFHELVRNPAVLARAQRAADEGDDDYLEAVLKEALRIRPVIWEVARLATDVATVGGLTLPKGVRIMPSIGLVQLDPAHFPDPHRFDPERFRGANPAPNTWIPFGGGTRRCLGSAFSMMESVIILREALQRYDLAPAPGSRWRRGPRPEAAQARNVTITPRRGGRMIATPRRGSLNRQT